VVTLLDTRPRGEIYKLLVDLSDGRIEEDISALLNAETQAYQAEYGRLEIALYNRLQEIGENDTLPVAIWIAPQPGQTASDLQQTIFTALAAKYPEAREAMERSGKPMDVDNPELAAQIEAEYVAMLNNEIEARVAPLLQELRRRGFSVTTLDGMPSIAVTLPKSVILELSQREDIGCIYLIEEGLQDELDSAVPNTLASTVWARGYDGSGVSLAILEEGNVDPNNTFLNHSPNARPGIGVQEHTTYVASSAASFHDTYRGMAYGATIVSAGHLNNDQADTVAALQWAFDQGSLVVNMSEGADYQDDAPLAGSRL
jgi:hypothetical protein